MKIMIDVYCEPCGLWRPDVLTERTHLPACQQCGGPTQRAWQRGPAVQPDDIPGGVLIEHGICYPDGTPKRYYSKSSIKQATAAAGCTLWDDQFDRSRLKDGQAYLDWRRSGEYARLKADRQAERMERRRR